MTSATDTPQIFGDDAKKDRSARQSMWRGMKKKCPRCSEGQLFSRYSKVNDHCNVCGLDFSRQQADDAPPYFTIMIVGHTVIPLALEMKRHLDPPMGFQLLFWSVILGIMTWRILPITKGALIGLQWAKRMHGFGDIEDTPWPQDKQNS